MNPGNTPLIERPGTWCPASWFLKPVELSAQFLRNVM
jgi:hypothetical protein